jgi:hypothetical protein
MLSGSDRVLRRGAARWERSVRRRRDGAPEDGGRHRAGAEERIPWRRRPRARLNSGLHRVYVIYLFLVFLLLWGGVGGLFRGPSRVSGWLAVVGGLVLVWFAVLYLRRPVKR